MGATVFLFNLDVITIVVIFSLVV